MDLRGGRPKIVESPYLLPVGAERRQRMAELGIRVCSLDYTEEEWAALEDARQDRAPGGAGDDRGVQRIALADVPGV